MYIIPFLKEQAGLVDVVVTHGPPTTLAIAPRFRGQSAKRVFSE